MTRKQRLMYHCLPKSRSVPMKIAQIVYTCDRHGMLQSDIKRTLDYLIASGYAEEVRCPGVPAVMGYRQTELVAA